MDLTAQIQTPSDSGQAGAPKAGKIEITPAMIEAGVRYLLDWEASEDYQRDIFVSRLFHVMAREMPNRVP